jgi:acetylornithine deacetylase/succinyl-diaminopimelate desuccinylase-like protein
MTPQATLSATQTATQAANRTALAQHRISQLATCLPVHRAFHWIHLHQSQLRIWQRELVAIPAPTFHESARAAWFIDRFKALGLANVHLDQAGNALGELHPSDNTCHPSRSGEPASAFVLVSAHLDTVFPAGTSTTSTEDGPRILGPGACDNAAGLTALLALIAAMRHANIAPPLPILFAANVCEEGEGDLRGMRHILEGGPYRGKIAAALALEGSGTGVAVTRALGSRRFRVTIAGPGGHSWSDAGIPNPILLIAQGLSALAALPTLASSPGDEQRTTFSPGYIAGGTSINSIPESASVLLDLRSSQPDQLDHHSDQIRRIFSDLTPAPARLQIDLIGDRPAAALPDDSPLLDTLRATDRHLGIRTELRLGSTDANIPLAMGIPAAALASGGTGGGIHTLAEWYDPTGREVALRRLLLVILDTAQTLLP